MPFFDLIGAEMMSIGDKWATSGITTLIGLGMTFVVLALLIGTILLLRLILKQLEKILANVGKKKEKTDDAAPESIPDKPVGKEGPEPIDAATEEAIRAAVMNYLKKDDNVVVIQSISRAEKNDTPLAVEETAVKSAPAPTAAAPAGNGTVVKAPMPGTILKIKAANGKQVKEGEVIFVLEAMKMENEIVAPAAGTFRALVAEGTKVNTGVAIAEIQ